LEMLQNLKLFEHQHNVTSMMVQCVQILFHAQNRFKYCIKLPSIYVYEVYIKHKWIILDLISNPKTSQSVHHTNITKSEKLKIWNTSSSKHFRQGILNSIWIPSWI
jgi:hypothetical protein